MKPQLCFFPKKPSLVNGVIFINLIDSKIKLLINNLVVALLVFCVTEVISNFKLLTS